MDNYKNFIEPSIIAYTCFNNKSLFGYKSGILKSGICKYFRRNEKDKFKWCVSEMLLFGVKDNGKMLVTNLINRLKILLMEDLCLEEINRIIYGINKLDEFEKGGRDNYKDILDFCDVVIGGDKCRTTSYVNCWWRTNNNDLDLTSITLDKVLKFKKNNDSEYLLQLGEKLIEYLDNYDEKIIDIFIKLNTVDKKNCGTRFRRKEGIYLFMEICKDYCNNAKLVKIFNFVLEMINRKSMKERYSFGVWFGVILWKRNVLDFTSSSGVDNPTSSMSSTSSTSSNALETLNYFKNRKHLKIDDYVIEDYHVNKKYSLEKFAIEGSFIKDETTKILGETKFKQYKDYYILQKIKFTQNKPIVDKPIVDKPIVDKPIVDKPKFKLLDPKFIDFNEFTNINVLEEGVCGGKTCCIIVEYNHKKYVIKEMGKSMNYGLDYLLIDTLKTKFGLIDLRMKRIRSNMGLVKKDTTKKSLVGNWEFKEKNCIYCFMDYYDNIGDLGKNKDILKDKQIKKELYKIRLFDGLFRSSDNILRNILVSSCKTQLISIDENDIYGKRPNIFNKNDWCTHINNIDKTIIDEILEEFDLENKIDIVKRKLYLYGFSDKIEEMATRFKNYRDIVYKEIK